MSADVIELIGVLMWGSLSKGYRPVIMMRINGTRVHYDAVGPCLENGLWSRKVAP